MLSVVGYASADSAEAMEEPRAARGGSIASRLLHSLHSFQGQSPLFQCSVSIRRYIIQDSLGSPGLGKDVIDLGGPHKRLAVTPIKNIESNGSVIGGTQ